MIIGLVGWSRAGKDSVASYLVKNHGFVQRNMADPIREILYRLFPSFPGLDGLNDDIDTYGWDHVKAQSPWTVDAMISLGQAARDIIGENVWLDSVVKDMPERLVIADCRQPNEYDFIREHGGEIWHILRKGTIRRGMDGLLDDRQFDVILYNNSSLAVLEERVAAVM